jgi:hypothetical protein
MTVPNIKLGTNLHKIDLEHAILDVITSIVRQINCHQIGTIQSFDSLTQTAVVSINAKKLISDTPVEMWRDYPPLVDVPVIILSGGGSCITFPINTGDECLLLFNDRDIDNWFKNSGINTYNTYRTHDLSDAIAIVGLKSTPNMLSSYNNTMPEIQGSLNITESIQAKNYISADGTEGKTEDVSIPIEGGGDIILHFKNGLYIGNTTV